MINKMIQRLLFIIYCLIPFTLMNITEVLAQQETKGTRTIYLIRHGDYAPQDDIYKSMELGVVLEAFLQGPLLMAYKKRQNVFIDLYVSISFGSKNY